MTEQEKITHWVKNGIEKDTIDQAFLWGWNFVCPNHPIKSVDEKIKLLDRGTTVFETVFKDVSTVNLSKVVNANKSDSLTTSQIRIVFGEMRRIQMNGFSKDSQTDFLLLKPKLAYAVKRHDKRGLTAFYKLFVEAYEAVDTINDENGKKHFENLMNLMEAVLAYHKYHGGKE